MTSVPNPYIVTETEITEVKELGFNISTGKISFADFLKTNFPGLHLLDYLNGINDLLVPLTTVTVEKEIVYFETPPPTLVIQLYSEDEANDQRHGFFARNC